MGTIKAILKWIVILVVILLVMSVLAKRHFEEKHKDECISNKKKNALIVPDLKTSNLQINGRTLTGRITNASGSDVRNSVFFQVTAKDCTNSECVVVGKDRYFTGNTHIPSGEARDFVAHAGRGELLNINSQGKLGFEIAIEAIDSDDCL